MVSRIGYYALGFSLIAEVVVVVLGAKGLIDRELANWGMIAVFFAIIFSAVAAGKSDDTGPLPWESRALFVVGAALCVSTGVCALYLILWPAFASKFGNAVLILALVGASLMGPFLHELITLLSIRRVAR